mmetsp:Transcript_21045/g.34729  ORF Transcript_21045/g.34729 Transcript_21045/m.34729 type:complete len:380 (+) Transcript_21045:112-1251(+)
MTIALRLLQATVLLSSAQLAAAYTPSSMSTSTNSPRWSSTSLFSAAAQDVDSAAATATASDDNITTRDLLSLDYIRSTLIRQEETIIFALIERAQFRQNRKVYEKGGVPGLGDTSFLEFMLSGTEKLHSAVRRYESPEEHAFFPHLLPERNDSMDHLDYPDLLSNDPAINALNWNPILYEKYINVIVPAISANGDDEQYGSTCVTDTAALQALSKRIHYGKFVAESKYLSNPEGFQELVDAGDAEGVMKLLTNAKVEEQVLTRARLKATTYGREPMLSSFPMTRDAPNGDSTSIIAAAAAMAVVAAVEAMQDSTDDLDKLKGKVDPAIIEAIYRELIIPMTKDIEVAYLFLRCGREPPKEYAADRMIIDVAKLSPRKAI